MFKYSFLQKVFSSSLVKSTGIYTLTSIINALTPFLLLPILTSRLSPSEYGLLSLFVLTQLFLSCFIGLNTVAAVSRHYFDPGINLGRYIGNCIYILVLSAAIVFGLVFLFQGSINRLIELPLKWVVIAGVICTFQYIILLKLALWQIRVKPLSYGVFQILQTFVNISLSIGLLFFFINNWESRPIAILITTLLFFIIVVFSFKNENISFKIDSGYIKDAVKFGLPLIPHSVGGILIGMTDRIILSKYLSIDETGIYSAAFQVGTCINLLTTALNNAYVPWLYSKLTLKNDNINKQIVKYTYVYFGILILVFLIAFLLKGVITGILIGGNFLDASKYVVWIFAAFVFNGMYLMVTNYIFFQKKTMILALTTLFIGVVNIPITYYLVKYYNSGLGAAISTCFSFFLLFIVTWYFSNKVHPMPWFNKS